MIQEILQGALSEAEKLGVYLIGRYQSIIESAVIINNGSVERIVSEDSRGLGVQVFTPQGYSGFAAGDSLDEATVRSMVNKATQLAALSEEFGGESNKAVFDAPHVVKNLSSPQTRSINRLSLTEISRLLQQENEYVLNTFPEVSVQSIYRQIDEQWHIVRSGGTSTIFSMPRSVLIHNITARKNGNSVSTRTALGGMDAGILLEAASQAESRARARMMGRLALDLLTAPPVKGGHYKLLIDYALAKGLAHEAFGHAVETDGVRTSILGRNGKLFVGMEVASSKVNIVDGPIEGDWAYQPISANAIPRETVTIVDRGKLAAGLADLFSAAQAGVPVTGAGRAENYARIPLPRMTNIRIEVADPIPLAKPWHQVSPKELYQLLLEHRLVNPGEEVYYLLGYKGGQVNTQFGDFVFNCSAIYKLGDEPLLCQPGIFSGKTLSALKSIRAGIGPMITDALGTCGKWGQGVPSSGGSHAFLLLDASPEITIGGE